MAELTRSADVKKAPACLGLFVCLHLSRGGVHTSKCHALTQLDLLNIKLVGGESHFLFAARQWKGGKNEGRMS